MRNYKTYLGILFIAVLIVLTINMYRSYAYLFQFFSEDNKSLKCKRVITDGGFDGRKKFSFDCENKRTDDSNKSKLVKRFNKNILSIKDKNISKHQIKKMFQCEFCLDELKNMLINDKLTKEDFEKLVDKISELNSKKAADFLLKIMLENIDANNYRNMEIIGDSLSKFNNKEVGELFLSFLFGSSKRYDKLSENVIYNIKKSIFKSMDFDSIGEKLASIYKNVKVEDEESVRNIINLNIPQVYAQIAMDSYENSDMESYKNMIDNLKYLPDERSLNAFMKIVHSGKFTDMEEIKKDILEWAKNNRSDKLIEAAIDYIGTIKTTNEEKMIALEIIAKFADNEKKDKILRKTAKAYEDNIDIKDYIAYLKNSLN